MYIRKKKYKAEKVQLKAVRQDGEAIWHIHNPTEKVQLEIVRQNWKAIDNIHNPTEKVQLKAVRKNGLAIWCINNPTKKVLDYLYENNREIFNILFEKVED